MPVYAHRWINQEEGDFDTAEFATAQEAIDAGFEIDEDTTSTHVPAEFPVYGNAVAGYTYEPKAPLAVVADAKSIVTIKNTEHLCTVVFDTGDEIIVPRTFAGTITETKLENGVLTIHFQAEVCWIGVHSLGVYPF